MVLLAVVSYWLLCHIAIYVPDRREHHMETSVPQVESKCTVLGPLGMEDHVLGFRGSVDLWTEHVRDGLLCTVKEVWVLWGTSGHSREFMLGRQGLRRSVGLPLQVRASGYSVRAGHWARTSGNGEYLCQAYQASVGP
jgi:hypothetical protein